MLCYSECTAVASPENRILNPNISNWLSNSTSEASTPRPSKNVLVSLSVVLRSLFADALMTNIFIVFMIFDAAKLRQIA